MTWKKSNKTLTTTNYQKYFKAISLVVALLVLPQCSEKIKEELPPLGTQTLPEDIDKALGEASSGTHIYYAKPGQYVEYEGNYRADLSQVVKLDSLLRTYKGKVESTENIIFQLNEDYYEFDRAGKVSNEKHSEVNLEMKKGFELEMNFSKSSAPSEDPYCITPDPEEKKYDCVRYYNLKIQDKIEPVPDVAQARANCSNVPGCQLPSKVIQFDRVKFLKGQIVEKEIFKFSISKAIPLLLPDLGFPPLNYFCISKLYDGGGVSYYITQCNVLRDLML